MPTIFMGSAGFRNQPERVRVSGNCSGFYVSQGPHIASCLAVGREHRANTHGLLCSIRDPSPHEMSQPNTVATHGEQPSGGSLEKCAGDSVEKLLTSARMNEIIDLALRTADKFRASKPYRLAIKTKGRIFFVELAEVAAIEARGNYVLVQQQSSSHTLRASISELARKLEPCGFIRIHRSVLVNSSWIQEIRPTTKREQVVRMRGGKEYALSRSYKDNLKSIAQFWLGSGGAFFDE